MDHVTLIFYFWGVHPMEFSYTSPPPLTRVLRKHVRETRRPPACDL
ncbi:hypothetical protein RSAG8_06574, partial [Rhizoctonia solani AG-8 WAC10335]